MARPTTSVQSKSYHSKFSLDTSVMNIGVIWYDTGKQVKLLNSNNSKSHFHNLYELHIPLNGSAKMMVDNHTISLEPGNYILIPPKVKHAYCFTSPDYHQFALGFYLDFPMQHPDSEWFSQTLSALPLSEPQICNPAIVNCYANMIQTFAAKSCPPSVIALQALMLIQQIACQINSQQSNFSINVSKEEDMVARVKAYISASLADGIASNDVAAYLNVDLRHLNRLLRKQGEPTVSDLIMDAKMNKICSLLETTDMSLERIAYSAGFSNEYNMSRAFKKSQGQTPGAYRTAYSRK